MQIVLAQIFGIGGMILGVASLQCRSNRNYFLFQETSGLLFTISFILFGAWSGALMNIYSMVRPEFLRREKFAKSKYTLLFLLSMLFLFSAIVFWYFKEAWYLILIVTVAQMIGTILMWLQNGKMIRIGQLCCVSPLWLLYNLLLAVPSIGGVLAELINVTSSIIALVRYRTVGFVK